MYVCLYVSACVYHINVYKSTHTYKYMCVYMYIYTHSILAYIFIHMYLYIYMYIYKWAPMCFPVSCGTVKIPFVAVLRLWPGFYQVCFLAAQQGQSQALVEDGR